MHQGAQPDASTATRFVRNDVDENVADFFKARSVTSHECDNFALATFGGPVIPVSVQGVESYTVVAGPAGEKIVQFRDRDGLLDMEVLNMAARIHPGFVVADTAFLGWIGHDEASKLAIYATERLPGDNYVLALSTLQENEGLQLAAVRSLARFYSQAWREPIHPDQVDVVTMATDLRRRLETLHSSGILTEHLQSKLTEVLDNLADLTSDRFRLALTHADLNAANILVDASSGRITGIIDWTGAGVQPFGLSLYALDVIVGYKGPGGWVFPANSKTLKRAFWKALAEEAGLVSTWERQTIRVAELAGYFLRYGTPFESGARGVVGVANKSAQETLRWLAPLLQ